MNAQDRGTASEVEDCHAAEEIAVLKQTKGTVIINITFAVKQDQELGREFLKYLKVYSCIYPCLFKKLLMIFPYLFYV